MSDEQSAGMRHLRGQLGRHEARRRGQDQHLGSDRRLDPGEQLPLDVDSLRAVLLYEVHAGDRSLQLGHHLDAAEQLVGIAWTRGQGGGELAHRLLQLRCDVPRIPESDLQPLSGEQRRPGQADGACTEHRDGALLHGRAFLTGA